MARIEDAVLEGELHRTAKEHWGGVRSMTPGGNPLISDVVSRALKILGRRVVRGGDPLRLMSAFPSVINCANGELWLTEDGPALRPHRPESFLMSCSGIMYDPLATAPTYDQLIESMFGNEDVVRHVNEMMGYLIQPTRFLKVFYILIGEGDNGKSQLMKLFARIVGHDAAYWDRMDGIEKDPHRIIHLLGKRALIDDDAEKGFLLPDGFLKRVSEEKPLTGRFLYKNLVDFIATIVVVLLSNHFPSSRDLSRGIRTRILVVKFPRQFLKPGEFDDNGNVVDSTHPDVQRPDLWSQVFESELPGVLNILIDAYYRLRERGAFEVPVVCQQAAKEWQGEANPLARFVSDMLENSEGSEYLVSKWHKLYTEWADAEGIQKRYVVGLHQFSKPLKSMGLAIKRSNRGIILVGKKPTTEAASELVQRTMNGQLLLKDLGLDLDHKGRRKIA